MDGCAGDEPSTCCAKLAEPAARSKRGRKRTEGEDDVGSAGEKALPAGGGGLVGPWLALQALVAGPLDPHGHHVLSVETGKGKQRGKSVGVRSDDPLHCRQHAQPLQAVPPFRRRWIRPPSWHDASSACPLPAGRKTQLSMHIKLTQLVNVVATSAIKEKRRKLRKLGMSDMHIATPPNTSAQSLRAGGRETQVGARAQACTDQDMCQPCRCIDALAGF